MEINFTHRTAAVYREIARPVLRIQEVIESVVPDTDEDIGRVVSVKASVTLKSKDLTSRGVLVTGGLEAALLYITENESAVSCVRLQKEFSMEFELGQMFPDVQTQVHLTVGNTETRVINPRKVAVTAELVGELVCYHQEEQYWESLEPENSEGLLHVKRETAETTAINAVCEKSFVLNEQFRFPDGKAEPLRLIAQDVSFETDDVQQVGSRVVVKGTVWVTVWYLTRDVRWPLRAAFSAPFSQIVDSGAESCDCGTVRFALTGCYFDLNDTISGEKALDAEIHAVLQLVSREKLCISYFSDAYSNRMPCVCAARVTELPLVSPAQRVSMSGEETISIAEDCEDALCVLTFPAQLSRNGGFLSALLCLDILYRSRGGGFSSVRRLLELEKISLSETTRINSLRLSGEDFRPEGTSIRCRINLTLEVQQEESQKISALSGVTLNEDDPWPPERFPGITLVRKSGDDLWTLAKRCHSNLDLINAANGPECGSVPDLLLIPREN